MKKFLSFLGTLAAIFSAVIGAMVVFDRITGKNCIKNGYLKCDVTEDIDSADE